MNACFRVFVFSWLVPSAGLAQVPKPRVTEIPDGVSTKDVKFISEGVIKGEEISLNIRADGGMDFGPTLLKRVK